jgi:Family of unknown function (DUF6152)
MEFRYLAAVLVATLIAPAVASAHHGYDDFYKDRRVTVEGVLEDIVYANPHVTMKLRTDAGDLYTALWEATNSVQRRGGTPTTFKAGDRVRVVGCPPRDPASRDIALLREVTRMSDGWTWRTE